MVGIPNTIYEFEPGRANLYARLKGDGSQRPLILLNHLDTVRGDSSQWKAHSARLGMVFAIVLVYLLMG
jgi:acetylornithine deacetylase/succinyl-diaminopimelate desuccinylase-like protein